MPTAHDSTAPGKGEPVGGTGTAGRRGSAWLVFGLAALLVLGSDLLLWRRASGAASQSNTPDIEEAFIFREVILPEPAALSTGRSKDTLDENSTRPSASRGASPTSVIRVLNRVL